MSAPLFAVPDIDPSEVIVDIDGGDGGGDDLSFDELVFLAEKIALSVLSNLKWEAMLGVARGVVTDDADANVIVKLLQNADYSVEIGARE